ncbi:MAG: hypothetical protein ABI767_00880 [Rhodanobacter sp.]
MSDFRLGDDLRQKVLDMTLPSPKGETTQGLHDAWVPVMFDDHRYQVSSSP